METTVKTAKTVKTETTAKTAKKVSSAILIVLAAAVLFGVSACTTETAEPQREFQGFIDASIYIAPFDEIVEKSERFVKLEILRELSKEEIQNLYGMDEYDLNDFTYFEAKVIIDYYNSDNNDEIIYFRQFGTYEWQLEDDPVLQIGDQIVTFMIQRYVGGDYWGPYAGTNSIFDIKTGTDGNEYLYKRLGNVPAYELSMTETEKSVVTSTIENPVVYSQKLTIESLASATENFTKIIDYTSFRDGKVSLYPISKEEITQNLRDQEINVTNNENETDIEDNMQDDESEIKDNENTEE